MENSDNRNIATRNTEVENIAEAAHEDAGFDASLVHKKGEYFIDEEKVPLGTEYLAHPAAWVKLWRKYDGEKVVDRKVYHVAKRERVPDREDLDDYPENENWPIGDDGAAYDPWALLYLIPFENPETGDTVVFSTRSYGGRRAVADLATAWARRCDKVKNCGLPKIKLAVTDMPTKKFGKVKRPLFELVGWEDGEPLTAEAEVLPPDNTKKVMGDEIPF
jgi:hypothetical protein